MLAFKLALRNIRAHGQRNLILFLVTSTVCLFLFLFLTFSDGEIENMKNGVASFWNPPSDLSAYHPELVASEGKNWKNDWILDNTPDILKALEDEPGLTQIVANYPHAWMNLFHQGKKYLGFSFSAQDAARDKFQKSRYTIVQGSDLTPEDSYQVLLHWTLEKDSSIEVGDEIILAGEDFWGQTVSQKVRVKGFFLPVLDNPNIYSGAYADLDTMRSLVGYSPKEALGLRLSFERGTDLGKKNLELNEKFGDVLKVEFVETAKFSGDSSGVKIYQTIRLILVAISLLLIFITAIGMMNVVSVNLYDRKKEIGTYFCLGTEKPFLLALYSWEIFLVNLGGSLTGLLVGLLIREGINGFKFTSTDPGFQTVMGGSVFYLGLSPSTIFWIVGGVMGITLVTAALILRKALEVSPVVAVREIED